MVMKSDVKKGLVLASSGGGWTQTPLGYFEPGVIRGRLGSISPLAFKVLILSLSYLVFVLSLSCLCFVPCGAVAV